MLKIVDPVTCHSHAGALASWAPAQEKRAMLSREILSLCDLTSLESTDTPARIEALCAQAVEATVAAVCVFPELLPVAVLCLRGSGVVPCAVAGGFPHGLSPIEAKLSEVSWCASAGAAEIDVVMNRSKFLAGEFRGCEFELSQMRKECPGLMMKVIVETCDLGSDENVEAATKLAISSGADFVKTSTGKGKIGAILQSASAIWNAVVTERVETGRSVGVKVSGGIRSFEAAARQYELARQRNPGVRIDKRMFRIGASALVSELIEIAEGVRE